MSRCEECHAPAIAYDDVLVCAENPEHEGTEDSPWAVTSDARAEWALQKLALAEQNIDRIVAAADDMIRRAEEYRERESKRFRHDADFFRGHLVTYYEKVAPSLGKAKTYALVSGEISSRQGSEVVVLVDEWAESAAKAGLSDLVRTKYEPDKAEIKKRLKSGVEIPGAHLERKPDEVKVRPARGEVPAYMPMPNDDESEAA